MTGREACELGRRLALRVNANPILGFGPRELQVVRFNWPAPGGKCQLWVDFPLVRVEITNEPGLLGRYCAEQPYLTDDNLAEFPPEAGDITYLLVGAAAKYRDQAIEALYVDAA